MRSIVEGYSKKCKPASVAQVTETVCTDRDGLSEEPGFNYPGRPVDFVFGFQGRMLLDYFLGQAKRVQRCPL